MEEKILKDALAAIEEKFQAPFSHTEISRLWEALIIESYESMVAAWHVIKNYAIRPSADQIISIVRYESKKISERKSNDIEQEAAINKKPKKISPMGKQCLDYIFKSLNGEITKADRLKFYGEMANKCPEHRTEWLNNAKWVDKNC